MVAGQERALADGVGTARGSVATVGLRYLGMEGGGMSSKIYDPVVDCGHAGMEIEMVLGYNGVGWSGLSKCVRSGLEGIGGWISIFRRLLAHLVNR